MCITIPRALIVHFSLIFSQAFGLQECLSDRPGWPTHRTLHVSDKIVVGKYDDEWASALCCVYTHVEVSSSIDSPILELYDGSERKITGSTFSEIASDAMEKICVMSMGSDDCSENSECVDSAFTPADDRAISEVTFVQSADPIFSGELEVVSDDPRFVWLESPLWSTKDNYLLFSDVKWEDSSNNTCGMVWKYDEEQGVQEFLRCAGLAGPGNPPDNLPDLLEAGPNGLIWGWDGEDDLIMCQHGMQRIVRFDVGDVSVSGDITPDRVTVLVDSYNSKKMNGPNDLVLVGEDLYFTDPPFGLQARSTGGSLEHVFKVMPQDGVGVYMMKGEMRNEAPVTPTRVLDLSKPYVEGPNGITVTSNGNIVVSITNFTDPRVEVYSKSGDSWSLSQRMETPYRIEGNFSNFPPLTDGLTYSSDLELLFVAGPGGIYVFSSVTFERLSFLRIDDLTSNCEVGGGYLWITANSRLLRIPLANKKGSPPSSDANRYKQIFWGEITFCCMLLLILN
mmetsp:Transcript_65389/g.76836  ORF Transcript_65389/g.76836 Transcript_65389/m.76836 type:complete len:508 (-) Transcript_65389:171-1694(-)